MTIRRRVVSRTHPVTDRPSTMLGLDALGRGEPPDSAHAADRPYLLQRLRAPLPHARQLRPGAARGRAVVRHAKGSPAAEQPDPQAVCTPVGVHRRDHRASGDRGPVQPARHREGHGRRRRRVTRSTLARWLEQDTKVMPLAVLDALLAVCTVVPTGRPAWRQARVRDAGWPPDWAPPADSGTTTATGRVRGLGHRHRAHDDRRGDAVGRRDAERRRGDRVARVRLLPTSDGGHADGDGVASRAEVGSPGREVAEARTARVGSRPRRQQPRPAGPPRNRTAVVS